MKYQIIRPRATAALVLLCPFPALIYHFEQLPELPSDYFGRPGLVHRLDKHTTGLMVVAKTENTLSNLAKQFFDRNPT